MIVMPEMLRRARPIEEFRKDRSKCKEDSGERTNTKLHDQPFYHRGKQGKMRKF